MNFFSCIVPFAFASACFFSCNDNANPFSPGSHIAAKSTDSCFYLATIKSDTGGKFQVNFDDGDQGDVAKTDMKVFCSEADLHTGDKVLASWNSSEKLYPGTVQEIQRGGVIVKWDDGSAPSFSPFGKIVKQ